MVFLQKFSLTVTPAGGSGMGVRWFSLAPDRKRATSTMSNFMGVQHKERHKSTKKTIGFSPKETLPQVGR